MKRILIFLMLFIGISYGQAVKVPNFWLRSGGTLSPSTATDSLYLSATSKLGIGTGKFRYNGGSLQFSNNGLTWDNIPTSVTGSAGGWKLSGADNIYQTTQGNKVHIRTAAGDTTGTGILNWYGAAQGTSLALGGATINTNALAVTGSATISGNVGITGNTNITGTYPYHALTPSGWSGGASYIQAGIDMAGISPGDYLAFENPAGKSFYFSAGVSRLVTILESGSTFIGYTADPTSGNKFAVNGTSYFNGNGTFTDNISIASTKYMYLAGDATTDGSWRIGATTSGSCIIEKRVSGNWVAAQTLAY